MYKKSLILLLSAGLMMGLTGCTSNKASDEEAPADVAEVAGEAGTDEVAATDESVDELGSDELSADEKLPEEGGAAEEAPTETAQNDDFADAPADEMADTPADSEKSGDMAANEAPKDEAALEPAPEPMAEPTPEPAQDPSMGSAEESLSAGGSEPTPPPEEEKRAPLPLRKIADAPYQSGKIWVNAVYLVRKGDSLDSVANKIYGSSDRLKELVRINPTYKTRDVKVGDKVYYNSPQRPDDNTKLLVFYEDMGLAPEIYVVNRPENIRNIAKTLLGDTNSWKELWSTNLDLESKGELNEGTQLRYWATTAAPMAASEPPMEQMAPPPEMPPTDVAGGAPPPPPPPPVDQGVPPPPPPPADQAMGDLPPPPPADVAGSVAPPPPPPTDVPPPPPPAEPKQAKAPVEEPGPLAFAGIEGQDQTMALGAGAILLLGGVLLVVMVRKRRSRRNIDFHTSTQTQIE